MKHYFNRIYCINLKKRPDRWEESLKEFAEYILDWFIDASYEYGIFVSDGV